MDKRGGGYSPLAFGGEMLLSARVWALVGVALVAVLLLCVDRDAGRLQAQIATPTPIEEAEILDGIYDAMGGDDWTTNTNWKSTEALSSWHGVTTNAAGRVTGLALGENNLTGSIPPELGQLTGLIDLSLWGNELTGSIPSELGDLSALQNLSLSQNDLTGEIPPELGDLSALRTLYLWGNELTGSIPSELGGLSALTLLSLSQNELTGSIPSELGDLSALTQMYLNQNNLTSSIPPELGDLSALVYLYLHTNQLTGSIPPELGNLSALERLYLYNNQLTGEIPSELGDLLALERMYLSRNNLTGSIPSELGNLSALTWLLLNENDLTGEIPSELGDLAELILMYLHSNQLTGSIPSELGLLAELTRLYLHDNQLTGEIPYQLGDLFEVQHVYLHDNQLTGEIPYELNFLQELLRLYLHNNQLTGSIPPELGQLPELVRLYLNDNQLTGSIPVELTALTDLERLYLHNNQLTGDLPFAPASGDILPLTHLYLHNNQLTGSIPSNLDPLGTLVALYLHNNQLSGEIPDLNASTLLVGLGLGGNSFDLDWSTFETGGNLVLDDGTSLTQSLQHLYLHDSGLTGNIPNWIGIQHTDLVELWLHDNSLTGSIPANFSNLTLLEVLRLEGNRLTGSIPEDLGNLTLLEVLRLEGNRLTGAIPAGFGELTMLEVLRLAGNLLTGGWEHLIGLPELEEFSLGLAASVFTGDSGRSVPIAGGHLLLKLSLPSGADPSRSSVTLTRFSVDLADVFVPRHPRGIGGIVRVLTDLAVDITTDLRDAQGEHLEGTLGVPVVCLPVPSADAGDDMRVLKSDDGAVWTFLGAVDPPSGYDPGAGNVAVCATTDSFSRFVPVVVEIGSGSPGAGLAGLISRIEPSIRDVTVSQGDAIRLSFDIYGRQDILNNELGKGHVFAWDDGGAGGRISATDRANSIIYTAPESPGTHTVTVTSPTGACFDSGSDDGDDRCTANFTITVRRSSAVSDERPAPKNPVGEIPSVLADAEGRQYEVFTPEEGGFFDGGEVTVSADPGVVPNLEIVGVRADAAGPASNVGMTRHRYTLVGDRYEVLAVDATETSISSYVLNSPLEVCVPLPPAARHDISNVAIVANNPDGTLTVLSASVRITASSGVRVCGNLGTLPASIAVGTAGSPEAIPTATPDPDEIVDPDTGGYAPSVSGLVVLLVMMIAGGVIVATGVAGVLRGRSGTDQV